MEKQFELAANSFEKAAQCENTPYQVANNLKEAAMCCKKNDMCDKKAIELMTNAQEKFVEIGNFNKVAVCQYEIAEIYRERQDIDEACIFYKKAYETHLLNDNPINACKYFDKFIDCLITEKKYSEACSALEEWINCNKNYNLSYKVDNNLFKAILCKMGYMDIEDTIEDVKYIEEQMLPDIINQKSHQYILLDTLIQGIKDLEEEEICRAACIYSDLKHMDDWMVTLLLNIKIKIRELNNDMR